MALQRLLAPDQASILLPTLSTETLSDGLPSPDLRIEQVALQVLLSLIKLPGKVLCNGPMRISLRVAACLKQGKSHV